jgi:hypothetical protein
MISAKLNGSMPPICSADLFWFPGFRCCMWPDFVSLAVRFCRRWRPSGRSPTTPRSPRGSRWPSSCSTGGARPALTSTTASIAPRRPSWIRSRMYAPLPCHLCVPFHAVLQIYKSVAFVCLWWPPSFGGVQARSLASIIIKLICPFPP